MTKNTPDRNRRRAPLILGASAIATAMILAGCSNSSNEPPPATPTTTTTAVPSSSAPEPTEKTITPGGGNLFSPEVKAPPAPTVPPGQHPGINGIP